MLGPTRDKLLSSQREALEDNDFGLDTQESSVKSQIEQINFMAEHNELSEALDRRLEDLTEKLEAIKIRRGNIKTSIQAVTDELGRTLKIRDAQSFTLSIPPDEEKLQHDFYLNTLDTDEEDKFVFTEPQLHFAHKNIKNIEDRNGRINFRTLFTKLFDYGVANKFSHKNYISVIGTMLTGNQHEAFLTIKGKGLQKVVDYFMASVQNQNDPMLAHSQCKHFMRRQDEGIRECMYRYGLLLLKAEVLFSNNGNHDSEKLRVLERSVGPKTLQAIESLQTSQVGLLNTNPIYDEILKLAERQENATGEYSNGIFHAYALLPSPTIHSVELDGSDTMQGKPLKRQASTTEKVANIRNSRREDPENRFYRANERNRGGKFYRNNTGSIESSEERNERSKQYPASIDRNKEYDERLQQAQLVLPNPVPSVLPQQEQQAQQSITPQLDQRVIIPAKEFNPQSSSSTSGATTPRNPFSVYREPAILPASQDYNHARSQDGNQYRPNEGYNRQSRSDGYRTRDQSPSNQSFDPRREQNTNFTNYRDRQYNRSATPFARGSSPYYGNRQILTRGDRSPSPQQRQSFGYANQQMGQFGLNYAMSERSWRVPGTHVPIDYDFKARPTHCTKCGGMKAHNGDVVFEQGHNDMECKKYLLYNEKGCMICNAMNIKAFHYENECRRNAGFAATMIRPLN